MGYRKRAKKYKQKILETGSESHCYKTDWDNNLCRRVISIDYEDLSGDFQ